MLNKVQLIGRIGKEPEVRTMQSGSKCASFSIATSERWKDKATGEQQEKTEWHRIVVFNDNLVGVVEKYLHKGGLVYIEGQLATRKYEKDGKEYYTTEVVLKFNGVIRSLSSATKDGIEGVASDAQPVQDDDIPF